MHILAYSGGSESTYMLDYVLRNDMPLDRVVFADTGLEYDETMEYIQKVERYYGILIQRVAPEKTFEDVFYSTVSRGANEGMMVGYPLVAKGFGCYWCRDAKVKPIEKLEEKGKNKVYLGYTASEKHRIQKVKDNLIYPLIENGIDESITKPFLKKRNIINEIYEKGYSRSGCYLCPKQPTKSLHTLYTLEPDKWEYMKTLERHQNRPFKPGKSLSMYEAEFKPIQNQIVMPGFLITDTVPKTRKMNIVKRKEKSLAQQMNIL